MYFSLYKGITPLKVEGTDCCSVISILYDLKVYLSGALTLGMQYPTKLRRLSIPRTGRNVRKIYSAISSLFPYIQI